MTSSENIFVAHTSDKAVFFADTSLDSKMAGNCDLFLLAEPNDVQIALKERRSGRILGFELLPLKNKEVTGWKEMLESVSSQSRILRNYEFLKVTAGIMSPQFTLVPEALYKDGDEQIYFTKNFQLKDDKKIYVQHVPSFHLYTIFSIDVELEKELNHLFQDPQLLHYSHALLSGISMQTNAGKGKQLWLNVRNDVADIVVFEERDLLLMNSYAWQKNEDILYYTLFVCEQMGMNPEKFILTATGDIDEGSALFRLLGNYIRTIEIQDKPFLHKTAVDLIDLPFHQYALLFNLALCE
jgi:hypothetical protein